MKPSIFLFAIILLNSSFAVAQNLLLNNTLYNTTNKVEVKKYSSFTNYQMQHCSATRAGEVLLIGGGVITGVGVIWLKKAENSYNDEQLAPTIITLLGGFLFFNGLVYFVGGEIYDHVHKSRYTLIIQKDQLGIAYNF